MYRKNTAGQFIHFQGVDATTGGIKSGVTWTMRRCLDGTFAAGGGTVTEDGTTGWYKCALAQADTNGNNCAANFTGSGAVPQTVNFITDGSPPDINVKNLLGTAWLTPGTAGTPDVNVKLWNGLTTVALPLVPTVAGRTLDCSAGGEAGVDWANVGTPGSTVNLSATTVNLANTVTTVTNQLTAAAIATGVWQDATAGDFTTASSIGKALYVANIVPGAAGGHFIAGTNAATTITGSLTTAFTGSLTGSVASVTGNVGGNVVGSVGSVTGLTASNLDATVSSRLASASYTTPPTANANADALLARNIAGGSSSGRIVTDALRFLRNKWSISGTTLTVCAEDDAATAWTATISTDATALPITGNDPA